MDRMEEIREREQAATPGPWISIEESWKDGAVGETPKMVSPWLEDAFEGDEEAGANMDFIYHARQDLPFLLDRIEQLEKQVEAYDTFIRRTGKLPDCNTCKAKKDCEYAPKLGDYVRVNCPLWRSLSSAEGEND